MNEQPALGETQNEKQAAEPKRFSRREFLKLAAISGGILTLNGCLPVSLPGERRLATGPTQTTHDHLVQPETNPDKEALEKVGLGDFYPFYQQAIDVALKYGAFADGYYFNRIFYTCWDVVTGAITDPDDPAITAIRDGWGEKSEQVADDALTHINSLKVGDEEYDNSKLFRKDYLTKFAPVFGPIALALPPQIYLLSYEAFTSEEMMVLNDPAYGWGSAIVWEVFMHEATHAVDVWSDRAQGYLSKSKFVDYMTTYYREADNLVEQWLQLPTLEEANTFFKGFVRGWGVAGGTSEKELIEKLGAVESRYFEKMFPDESTQSRFERAAWRLGRNIALIRKKERDEVELNQQERQLLDDEDMAWIMSYLIEFTLHFLVNPPENYFFNQPSSNKTSPALAREKMMNVRLDTFVTLPLDTNTPRDEQILSALGIL